MWRSQSVHVHGESEYLDDALRRVEEDPHLRGHAEALLHGAAFVEPLIVETLRAPQSPHHHAEGPFVEDHLRLALASLFAVLEEKLHLIDIEEFRRMKGFEGEFDELEETIKENSALLEAFILCHDAAKWSCVFFNAPGGSRGHNLGFAMDPSLQREELAASERAKFRQRYLELYDAFAAEHPNEPASEVQAKFFLAYEIEVKYPGHDRAVHSPVYRSLLRRVASAHQLTPRDTELLEDLIAHHLEPIADFKELAPKRVERYVSLAAKRGYDPDDFIDLLQAGLFLDVICASKHRSAHGFWHDPLPLVNFLRSEHAYAPWKRGEKEREREAQRKRATNRAFREAGLDGVALLELLNMEAGPAFGKLLREVQEAVLGAGTMPEIPSQARSQINERAKQFRDRISTLL